jgi:mRNA-degrading endonuclease toxin of MazEF toxin-antitoxin module
MKPWEVWTWKFPDAGEHPAVVLGTDERVRLKPRVCVILCSTQRAARKPEVHEVILDEADGLDWETLCKCDVVYAAPKTELVKRRGSVTAERRVAQVGQWRVAQTDRPESQPGGLAEGSWWSFRAKGERPPGSRIEWPSTPEG